MRKIYIICILTMLLYSCNTDDDGNGDTYSYTYTENSELTVITGEGDTYMKYGVVEPGDKLVFLYEFVAETDKNLSDDGYFEYIKFEIDPELESFSYSNTELITTDLVLTQSCFCYFPYSVAKDVDPIGTISGVKTSKNTWNINFNLTFYGGVNITSEAKYSLIP
ncbi:hypothetical protein [uncultured Formosa sp.]|uniref:hypothetical protein n=1 Tax=uncultured Formosa sp. TaxID=255435 RepID=UPI002638F6AD|nr:hypothetical protein [uncultured Formosa sp.]